MKITRAESFMLQVPIGREIADGMQATRVLEFVGINVSTDDGQFVAGLIGGQRAGVGERLAVVERQLTA